MTDTIAKLLSDMRGFVQTEFVDRLEALAAQQVPQPAMDEQRAMELVDPIEDRYGWTFDTRNDIHNQWLHGSMIGVNLDGAYSADELEAIAWWMRNKEKM